MNKVETLKLTIKTCAGCPFRLQVGIMNLEERCFLVPEHHKDLEYSIVPAGRDKICPLPKKIKFDI